jgi:hypothetical protein
MNNFKIFLLFLVAPTLSAAGSGQVYQSKDAQGNTVFSDMPSEGAQTIKVAPTNTADPVEDIPALATPEETEPKAQPSAKTKNSPAREEVEDETDYWVGDEPGLDDVDNIRRRRDPGKNEPGVDRPRAVQLPAATRPAGVGGRR